LINISLESCDIILKFFYMIFHLIHFFLKFVDGSVMLLRLLIKSIENFLV
jgi:hypothetical protein